MVAERARRRREPGRLHDVALDLFILLAGIWAVAVTLRPLGLPTVMGELIVGVVVGPAVLGLIAPSNAIQLLAEIGIFFLMFHAGVETQPQQFFHAMKRSLGVAIVGAAVPFGVSFGIALAFGLGPVGATFVGLTMTATAVVITLKSLKDLGLGNTRVARVIVASCVIDDLLTLVFFGLLIGMLTGGTFEPITIAITVGKVAGFFGAALLVGRYIYPRLTLPFRSKGGKGFTFVLLMAFALGLLAEWIDLHMILGAYLAGLFFEEKVAHPKLVKIVLDRSYGIAYSFLGPIFFISLGFSITFDISPAGFGFLAALTVAVIVGQILSAGAMAFRIGLAPREALTVGVGMCGRAELAFILASLALSQGAIDQPVFSVLIFTAFVLNLFTPLALKGCAILLQREAGHASAAPARPSGATESPAGPAFDGVLPHALPDVGGGVVIHGYGPEVEPLLAEFAGRDALAVVIEEDEAVARRLFANGQAVVHSKLAELDLRPLAHASALVANGTDESNAVFALDAREQGFAGPIVALTKDPNLHTSTMLAGATVSFTPTEVLASALAARASARIGPRVTGAESLAQHLEIAELRVHADSPLANRTLAEMRIRTETGANIIGRWRDDELRSPPGANEPLPADTILVAAGTPSGIRRLSELARPIPRQGPIVVAGFGRVGRPIVRYLRDAGESVSVIDANVYDGVDVVGDVLERKVLERASAGTARAVILALDDDSATEVAVTVIRQHAPDIPVIAGVRRVNNVERIQQAGADFALSLSQVAGQLLARHVLGETVSLHPRIKLVKTKPGSLEGQHPLTSQIRERTRCNVVAVQRGDDILMDFPPHFTLRADDALYLCGTANAIHRYREAFAAPLL